jgi:hypothetical protein
MMLPSSTRRQPSRHPARRGAGRGAGLPLIARFGYAIDYFIGSSVASTRSLSNFRPRAFATYVDFQNVNN